MNRQTKTDILGVTLANLCLNIHHHKASQLKDETLDELMRVVDKALSEMRFDRVEYKTEIYNYTKGQGDGQHSN